MSTLNYSQMSFCQPYVNRRKIKDTFFVQINTIINWNKIEKKLKRYYNKGESASGRKAYSALLLFKMSLLQTWYGLSDYQIEEQVNDRISFMKFCGLRLEDEVPDHSAICRFRSIMTKKKGYEQIFQEINTQLEEQGILVKKGAIIDASITPSPRKPKGRKEYAVEGNPPEIKEVEKKGVDREGSWVKKAGRLAYGYKKHYLAEKHTALVLAVETSTAKEHDSKYLERCVIKGELKPGLEVLGDKGYFGAPNREVLEKLGLKERIQRKGVRGKKLRYWEKLRNKLISKDRYKIERVFGGIKRWFKSGICRYVGQAKIHSQHVLEAIAYNIKVSPGIIVSKGLA